MHKIVFIVGMARSGSTLLTALLNEVDGFAGLGEAHLYWELADSGRRCGCNSTLDDCPVWGPLRCAHSSRDADIAEMRASFHDLVRPRPSSLLRTLTAGRGGRTAVRAARYAETMGRTYQWLAERTGATVLVDSTKLPAATELAAAGGETPVYVVHLVRDPRAVAHSLGRRKLNARGRRRWLSRFSYLASALRATVDWTLRNAYVEAKLRRVSGRYIRLHFEDLARYPHRTLEQLLAMVGAEADADIFIDGNTVEMGENHILTGDESRFRRGRVEIAPQEKWREEMPYHVWLATTIIASPLLGLYSYPALPGRR